MSNAVPRRMPIRTVELDFTGDDYPGFHATARLNIPLWVGDELKSGDEERARVAFLAMFPKWDFVDEDGKEIPHTLGGIATIPQDLSEAMYGRRAEAMLGKAKLDPKAGGNSPPTSPSEPEESEAVESPSPTAGY